MASFRLPRFKRAPTVAPIKLTERDHAIIRLVHRHGFLRSSHIIALMGDSPQQVLRRLQLLYHHGFLERPRAQIEYYHQGGSRHIIYGLGTKGASLLKQESGADLCNLRSGVKTASVGRLFFQHSIFVSDIMVALELACRKVEGVHLLREDEFPGGTRPPSKWRVKVNNRVSLGIIPDRVFALASDTSPDRKPAFFFLEADRGTMPVVRKNLAQSSFYRKLLTYEATWATGLHRSQFGLHRFRVVTVTTSAARVESLVAACSELKRGHGLFLFCDQATVQKHGDMLTVPWKTGRGETARLLP
jgi:protein involved in plasmid replication-relaxation